MCRHCNLKGPYCWLQSEAWSLIAILKVFSLAQLDFQPPPNLPLIPQGEGWEGVKAATSFKNKTLCPVLTLAKEIERLT